MRSAGRVVFTSLIVCAMVLPLPGAFGQITMQIPKAPDLVVRKIMISGFTQGDIHQVHLKVQVKNIGRGEAPPCTVALCYTSDIMGRAPLLVQTAQIPTVIKRGNSKMAEFSFYGVTTAGLPDS